MVRNERAAGSVGVGWSASTSVTHTSAPSTPAGRDARAGNDRNRRHRVEPRPCPLRSPRRVLGRAGAFAPPGGAAGSANPSSIPRTPRAASSTRLIHRCHWPGRQCAPRLGQPGLSHNAGPGGLTARRLSNSAAVSVHGASSRRLTCSTRRTGAYRSDAARPHTRPLQPARYPPPLSPSARRSHESTPTCQRGDTTARRPRLPGVAPHPVGRASGAVLGSRRPYDRAWQGQLRVRQSTPTRDVSRAAAPPAHLGRVEVVHRCGSCGGDGAVVG